MNVRLSFWISLMISLLLAGCAAGAATPTVTPTLQQDTPPAVDATVSALSTQVAALQAELQKQKTATPVQTTSATAPSTTQAATAAPSLLQSSGCEQATFVADITIPDGTTVPPGSVFTKTWAIKNSGSCAWTSDYRLVYAGGDLLGAQQSVVLSDKPINPGETAYVSVQFTAPQTLQVHRSFWKFLSASGREFGVTDPQGNEQAMWTEIRVSNVYDFVDNMCSATWSTGSGSILTCSGDPSDPGGAVYRMNNSQWEGGVVEDEPVIVMAPPTGSDTTIIGQFPPVIVPEWSWLKTRVGCLAAQESTCNVSVKITYSVDGGPEQLLYQGTQSADGEVGAVNVKMIDYQLFGKSTSFLWYVTVNGASDGDKIFWFTPVLEP